MASVILTSAAGEGGADSNPNMPAIPHIYHSLKHRAGTRSILKITDCQKFPDQLAGIHMRAVVIRNTDVDDFPEEILCQTFVGFHSVDASFRSTEGEQKPSLEPLNRIADLPRANFFFMPGTII